MLYIINSKKINMQHKNDKNYIKISLVNKSSLKTKNKYHEKKFPKFQKSVINDK